MKAPDGVCVEGVSKGLKQKNKDVLSHKWSCIISQCRDGKPKTKPESRETWTKGWERGALAEWAEWGRAHKKGGESLACSYKLWKHTATMLANHIHSIAGNGNDTDTIHDAPYPDVSYSSTNEKLPADTHTYLSIFVSTNTNIHTLLPPRLQQFVRNTTTCIIRGAFLGVINFWVDSIQQ